MKKVVFLLLCIALTVSATDRILESGSGTSVFAKGSYTLISSFDPDMAASAYGMAIKDDATDRLWISSWGDGFTYEFDMSTGFATGNSWEITNGIDADDMAFCEYTSGNQYFIGDWTFSNIGVFDNSGVYVKGVAGPAAWTNIFPIGVGHDMIYAERGDEIAWGSYTGTETSVTWTTDVSPLGSCYGMAVYGDYLFACCDATGEDNLFIFEINADGSLNLTPVWSCEFTELGPNGSLDYDGTYLYVYPQNDFVYKLDIDWVSLENTTWGQIKAEF